jgi:hypothetical protein
VEIVKAAPRVWIITDSERLGRRFEDDFLRVIVEQFTKVYDAEGVAVLVTEGWEEPPPVVAARRYDAPIGMGPLALAGWERGEITAEGRLPMTLLWQKAGAIDDQINTSVQVFAADGTAITQADGPPARGMTATFDFDRVVLPDVKKPLLPADLAPGRYRIDVVAYRVEDGALLSEPVAVEWFTVGPPPAPPNLPVNAAWQDGMTLVGHDDLPTTLDPRRHRQSAAGLARRRAACRRLHDFRASAGRDRPDRGAARPRTRRRFLPDKPVGRRRKRGGYLPAGAAGDAGARRVSAGGGAVRPGDGAAAAYDGGRGCSGARNVAGAMN